MQSRIHGKNFKITKALRDCISEDLQRFAMMVQRKFNNENIDVTITLETTKRGDCLVTMNTVIDKLSSTVKVKEKDMYFAIKETIRLMDQALIKKSKKIYIKKRSDSIEKKIEERVLADEDMSVEFIDFDDFIEDEELEEIVE